MDLEMTDRHRKFFELARRLSKKSDHHIHHLGAVIVSKNRIISFGYNQLKTHSKAKTPYRTLHAEIHALLGIEPGLLKGSDIYVYRENRLGQLANSKPCVVCQKMLTDLELRNVYYCTPFGFKWYRID